MVNKAIVIWPIAYIGEYLGIFGGQYNHRIITIVYQPLLIVKFRIYEHVQSKVGLVVSSLSCFVRVVNLPEILDCHCPISKQFLPFLATHSDMSSSGVASS